jgi:hypothetical protein
MNVNEINLAGTAAALNKEAVQLKTLPINTPFIIENLKVCKGPFGECILCELERILSEKIYFGLQRNQIIRHSKFKIQRHPAV